VSFLLGDRPGGVFLTQKHFLGRPHQLLPLLLRSRNHQHSSIISILHLWRLQLRQWQWVLAVTLIMLSRFCSSIISICSQWIRVQTSSSGSICCLLVSCHRCSSSTSRPSVLGHQLQIPLVIPCRHHSPSPH